MRQRNGFSLAAGYHFVSRCGDRIQEGYHPRQKKKMTVSNDKVLLTQAERVSYTSIHANKVNSTCKNDLPWAVEQRKTGTNDEQRKYLYSHWSIESRHTTLIRCCPDVERKLTKKSTCTRNVSNKDQSNQLLQNFKLNIYGKKFVWWQLAMFTDWWYRVYQQRTS